MNTQTPINAAHLAVTMAERQLLHADTPQAIRAGMDAIARAQIDLRLAVAVRTAHHQDQPPPILAQLIDHAHAFRPHGYLAAYRNDLFTHDRDALANSKAGARYVWLLRETGTELFPVAVGMDATWLTFWLRPSSYQAKTPPLAYLVTVTADAGARGFVCPIDHDRARDLAAEPHPTGRVIRFSMFSRKDDAAALV